MKKKFSLFFLILFLFFFQNKSYSLDGRCKALFENIKKNDPKLSFDELDYNSTDRTNFEFDLFWNEKENEWKYKRDEQNNLLISKINDAEEDYLPETKLLLDSSIEFSIQPGDKIISIIIRKNGQNNKLIDELKISDLSDNEIDELLKNYYNLDVNSLNENQISFKILNSYKKELIKSAKIVNSELAFTNISVLIKNISNINVKENTFDADLEFNVDWDLSNLHPLSKDYLIVNKSLNEYWYCFFNPKEVEEMQIGRVFWEPVNSIRTNELLIEDKFELNISDFIYWYFGVEDGSYRDKYDFVRVSNKKKGSFIFENQFNLKAFPFDRQILKIKIADRSRHFSSLSMDIDSKSIELLRDFQKKDKILEWKIVDTNINNYYEYEKIYDVHSQGIEIAIEIERNYQYYLFKVVLPIILILLVSWSVFWIHPRELESKLTITIVCLLSLIAYNFVIDKDLPKLSYLTILDYIVLLSYVFATIPNFISIYSFEKFRSKKLIWKKVDRNSRIYGPIIYLLLVFFIITINVSGNENTSAFLSFLR